jgi:hypothetical protein
MWFVQFQEGAVEGDAPAWGIAMIVAVRLLVDFVGSWLAVSGLRLVFALGRLGLTQLRARWQQEIS